MFIFTRRNMKERHASEGRSISAVIPYTCLYKCTKMYMYVLHIYMLIATCASSGLWITLVKLTNFHYTTYKDSITYQMKRQVEPTVYVIVTNMKCFLTIIDVG